MARDRPSPYGKPRRYPLTVAWGPVPRERDMARETRSDARMETSEGPSLTGPLAFPLHRSAGACPPRAWHGEGQALALREGKAFVSPLRGVCLHLPFTGDLNNGHRDVERFRKHPQ